MLIPHPAVLRRLVEEYEAVTALDTGTGRARASTRAQDLAYTLCVSTGTREVDQALQAARRMLAAASAPEPHATSTPATRPSLTSRPVTRVEVSTLQPPCRAPSASAKVSCEGSR